MKIYAEFIDDNGLLFRTKTLLQYGDSWDLIGSIVMKNPGSAKPGTPLNEDSKIGISEFYAEDINFENWTEAINDPTLKKVAAIFDGSYLEKNIEFFRNLKLNMDLDDDSFYICTELTPRCFVVQKVG